MTSSNEPPDGASAGEPFEVRDCALIAIATGTRAWTLKELHDRLLTVSPDSLYYHFWGGLLEPRFEEREYNNDIAGWARHGLHDGTLTEQLAMVDPSQHADLEELRQAILEIIETRLDESDFLPWARATQQFEFVRSQIVTFDTQLRARSPEELAALLPRLSTSSIFYHFIDARRRTPGHGDDFSAWLDRFGAEYASLREALASVDPYYATLADLRREIAAAFEQPLKGDPE